MLNKRIVAFVINPTPADKQMLVDVCNSLDIAVAPDYDFCNELSFSEIETILTAIHDYCSKEDENG
jgi:hypothetical protein